MEKKEVKKVINKLIESYNKFKENKELMSNERQACDTLIRPFFRDVLWWNVDDPYEFKYLFYTFTLVDYMWSEGTYEIPSTIKRNEWLFIKNIKNLNFLNNKSKRFKYHPK